MTDPRIERIAKQWSAATAASRMAVLPLLDAEATTDAEVAAVVDLFDGFDAEKRVYKVGEVVAFGGVLFRCVQAHTTQADWTPDKVPALFKVHRTPEMTEWVAGIAVAVGERFTYGGATWECVQAHTTQQGWEPDRVPSLWKKVA